MRADFATIGSGLTYEIRNIVEIANFMKSKGMEISWENIGDPVMKGEQVPEWIKDVLKEVIDELFLDDTVDLIEEMPSNVVKRILRTINPQERKIVNEFINKKANNT